MRRTRRLRLNDAWACCQSVETRSVETQGGTPNVENRLTPYEAGWLTLLVSRGICSEADARDAMRRVAQAAIDELNARREMKRRIRKNRRRKKPKDE